VQHTVTANMLAACVLHILNSMDKSIVQQIIAQATYIGKHKAGVDIKTTDEQVITIYCSAMRVSVELGLDYEEAQDRAFLDTVRAIIARAVVGEW